MESEYQIKLKRMIELYDLEIKSLLRENVHLRFKVLDLEEKIKKLTIEKQL